MAADGVPIFAPPPTEEDGAFARELAQRDACGGLALSEEGGGAWVFFGLVVGEGVLVCCFVGFDGGGRTLHHGQYHYRTLPTCLASAVQVASWILLSLYTALCPHARRILLLLYTASCYVPIGLCTTLAMCCSGTVSSGRRRHATCDRMCLSCAGMSFVGCGRAYMSFVGCGRAFMSFVGCGRACMSFVGCGRACMSFVGCGRGVQATRDAS
eukprot:551481-Rhodomonas_salina.1